jgi:hypothetical protein
MRGMLSRMAPWGGEALYFARRAWRRRNELTVTTDP